MGKHGNWKDTAKPPMFGYNGMKTQTKSTSLTDALSNVAEGVVHALKSSTPTGSQSPLTTSRPLLNEIGASLTKCASSILNNFNSFISCLNLVKKSMISRRQTF